MLIINQQEMINVQTKSKQQKKSLLLVYNIEGYLTNVGLKINHLAVEGIVADPHAGLIGGRDINILVPFVIDEGA